MHSILGAGTFTLKAGLAQMLKGGIIMDVTDAAQAKIAEEAGVGYCIITVCSIRELVGLCGDGIRASTC